MNGMNDHCRCPGCGRCDAHRKIEQVQAALENCRLFAARHRKEDWAHDILRFCAEGGATGTPLRKKS